MSFEAFVKKARILHLPHFFFNKKPSLKSKLGIRLGFSFLFRNMEFNQKANCWKSTRMEKNITTRSHPHFVYKLYTNLAHLSQLSLVQTRVNWLKITGQSLHFKKSSFFYALKLPVHLRNGKKCDPSINLPFREKRFSKGDRNAFFAWPLAIACMALVSRNENLL